jgi:hypothetical protein
MVKVSGGARTLTGVGKHLAYLGRDDFVAMSEQGERPLSEAEPGSVTS